MGSLYVKLLAACHQVLCAVFAALGNVGHGPTRTGTCQRHPRNGWGAIEISGSPPSATREKLLFPEHSVDVVGEYSAAVVPWPMKSEAVQAMLPRELELGPQSLTPPGQHPVLWVFGRQRSVRPNFLKVRGMRYSEFIVAIPYVQWVSTANAYRGPFTFLPRLYLDHPFPVILGILFGLAKRWCRFRQDEYSDCLSALCGNSSIVRGRFTPHGPVLTPTQFPLFAGLRPAFEQPLIDKPMLGPLLGAYFDWELDRASMQALDAEVEIQKAFLPGLTKENYEVKGINQVPLGAFRFLVPWTVTLPFLPSALRTQVL